MKEIARSIADILFDGNEGYAQICNFDWSATPLGPLAQWSPELCTAAVQILAIRAQLPVLNNNAQLAAPEPHLRFEAQLHHLLAQLPVSICILHGPQHIVVAANNRTLELWSKTAEQVMFKPIFEGVPEVAGQNFEKLFHQVYYQQKSVVANDMPAILMRNGRAQTFYFDVVYEPFRQEDGTVIGIVAVAMEVTAAVEAQKKMKESERQKMGILNSFPAHVAVLNARGDIVMVNDAWNNFAIANGGSALQGMGVGENYLTVLQNAKGEYSDEAPIVSEGILAVLNGELPFYFMEYPCHSPTQQRWFMMKVSPLGSAEGGVIVAHTEVSERRLSDMALRESEQRLRSSVDMLAQNVQEHALALAKMREQLRRKK